MAKSGDRISASERLRHAATAGLVAMVLAFSTLLLPLDQLAWTVQARLADFEASGDIVFVGSDLNLADEDQPELREDLAGLLDRMRERGVERVYIDIPFNSASDPAADARLNRALRNYAGNAVLVQRVGSGMNGELQMTESVAEIASGVPVVASHRWRNLLGYTWYMPYSINAGGSAWPTLPTALAEIDRPQGEFLVNYGFDISTIPTFQFRDLAETSGPLGSRRMLPDELAGTVVVIGSYNRADAVDPNIPGQVEVAASMVDIFAAETIKAGIAQETENQLIPWLMLVALGLASLIRTGRQRHLAYGMLTAAIPVSILVSAQLGVIVSVVSAAAMLSIYAALRLRAKWQRNYRLIDPDTGLPTFAALEADSEVAETVPAIIVARIHRFEEVRKTLPADLHAEYVLRIVDRLKAAKKDATIYLGPSHAIAWTFPEKEPALIREHLEGLRALFSSPLLVGNNQVDVGITFGADITPSPAVSRRLAAAIDAAERTTETYEPIVIAELASDEDLIWNISLQARIDAALTNGEIYTIYQPKVLVATGEMIGVEALVRWRDPIKGLIPPDHFIKQCETAGRMSHLTRHVLTQACRAGNAFAERNVALPVSVNISATLVHERDIVRMVHEVLADTGFDPLLLTLEITETYRISNHERAAEVLGELRALGPKISMDDFGVGAASLEALQRLPFDELKIDRMFTSAMRDDPKAAGIVRSVLMMGRELRIIVVAEGVEDEATLTMLRDSGCIVAQGFGLARPASFEEILVFERLDLQARKANMV